MEFRGLFEETQTWMGIDHILDEWNEVLRDQIVSLASGKNVDELTRLVMVLKRVNDAVILR